MIEPRADRAPVPRTPPPYDGGPLALVCLGAVPWGRSWKRIQSMVHELSRRQLFDRVVFVNPKALWLREELADTSVSLRERIRRLRDMPPHRVSERVHVLSMCHFLPSLGRFGTVRRLEERLFRDALESRRGGLPFVLLNNHPNFFSRPLLTELMRRSVLSIYDMSDDFVEYHVDSHSREVIGESVAFACRHSDLVFTINEHVREKYGPLNPRTFVIGNCTNYSNFDRPTYRAVPWMEAIRAKGRPVLGYTGIVNRVRVDYELLTALLQRRRDWEFVFVGSADRSFLELVRQHPNLHHHSQVDYDLLPDHIAGFDVAIIPFRVNEHTRGNDLLKFNDYLAMGSSIVTTDTGGAQKYREHLRIAGDVEAFVAGVEEALAEDRRSLVDRRKAVARANSWEHRAQEIETLLRRYLASTPEPVTDPVLEADF